MGEGPYVAIAHDALDLTVQPSPKTLNLGLPGPRGHQTWDAPTYPLLLTSGAPMW